MPRQPLPLSFCLALIGIFALADPRSTLAQTGIRTNGSSQYVTFGAAPSLSTPTFTVELWFRRANDGDICPFTVCSQTLAGQSGACHCNCLGEMRPLAFHRR